MKSRLFIALFALTALFIAVLARRPSLIPFGDILTQKVSGRATIASRLDQYGEVSRSRLKPLFKAANVNYPPHEVVLLAFKEEKMMEIHARNSEKQNWKFVAKMPILGASGKMGPKLKEGDLQVPEGFYKLESLNPNSAFHLSLRVSYPSVEDEKIAAQEDRTDLGGDIMIHGGKGSVGCLAMGDDAAENLFVLAAECERENVQIIICPLDFRVKDAPKDVERPKWVSARYQKLREFCGEIEKS